jgi:hypothetical protein
MPKKRKEGTVNTTISVSWGDKNKMRRLAKLRKTTKNGEVYESDSVIFNRILRFYMDHNPSEVKSATTVTYPVKNVSKPEDSPNESQQG